MKVIENAEWIGSRRNSEASKRYDEIAAPANIGKTFVIERGVDFDKDEDPVTVRLRYVGSLRWRGVQFRSALRDGNIYIKVTGHKENGERK